MNRTTWSKQQQDIFDWFRRGSGHLLVRARAGTGKTTTLIQGIEYAPESKILLAAFNKSIAVELGERLTNPHAEAKTLHSLGFRFIRRNWESVRIDSSGDRARRMVRKACGDDVPDAMVRLAASLASKGKAMAPMATELGDLTDIIYGFDLVPDEEWEEEGYDAVWLEQTAIAAMGHAASTRDGMVDFDDMLFIPVRNRWVRRWFDLVVIDEAQDMNKAQLMLATGACRGRIVVMGDDRQGIYRWRGADASSLDRMKGELQARELGLTVTYRCPKKIVELAAKIVPDFEAAATAPEGSVTNVSYDKMLDTVQCGDFVLSRKNAPLVATCLRLLQQEKRAKIQGRDIGAGLLSLIRKLTDRSSNMLLSLFHEKLQNWERREVERLKDSDARHAETLMEQIHDRADTLRALADGLTSLRELEARIEDLFSNTSGPHIVCSSVHRAKGLEANRVYILRDSFNAGGKPSRDERVASAQRLEEQNLRYVAITRAKSELFWVDELP